MMEPFEGASPPGVGVEDDVPDVVVDQLFRLLVSRAIRVAVASAGGNEAAAMVQYRIATSPGVKELLGCDIATEEASRLARELRNILASLASFGLHACDDLDVEHTPQGAAVWATVVVAREALFCTLRLLAAPEDAFEPKDSH